MINSMLFQCVWAPILLGRQANHVAHGHTGHGGGGGLIDAVVGAIIRGFGWRLGASLAESLIHLGIVVVLIVAALIFAVWFLKRRRDA